MALIINTPDPHGLVQSVKKAIDDKVVETWAYDSQGDFTHSPPQWAYRAWMRPAVPTSDVLILAIVATKKEAMTKEVYAIYHGRFIEMLLAHFDMRFSNASATALLQAVDVFK